MSWTDVVIVIAGLIAGWKIMECRDRKRKMQELTEALFHMTMHKDRTLARLNDAQNVLKRQVEESSQIRADRWEENLRDTALLSEISELVEKIKLLGFKTKSRKLINDERFKKLVKLLEVPS